MRPWWVYLAAFLLLAAAILGASVFFIYNPSKSQQQRTLEEDVPQAPNATYSSSRSVMRFTNLDQTVTYYRLIGHLTKHAASEGTTIMSELIIDEDPDKIPITIVLDVTSGTGGLVIFPSSFEEEQEGSDVSVEVLLSHLRADTRVAVYLRGQDAAGLSSALDDAVGGQWRIPTGQTANILFTGVIGKEQAQ